MPEITAPTIDINKAAAEVTGALKDGAYVAIGLGVLGFQRAQVQRVELTKQLERWFEGLRAPGEEYAQAARQRSGVNRTELAEQLSAWTERLQEALAPVRDQLASALPGDTPKVPDLGRQLLDANQTMEAQLETIRTQLAQLARAVDHRVQPVRHQLDEQFDRWEQSLPPAARSLVHTVRATASEPEHRLRNIVGLD